MEAQIHHLEQEAYSAVLRAFKAQGDAITWEKESLITELRKELRVSDEQHRELLNRVNSEDTIRQIRDWRQGGGNPVTRHVPSQTAHDVLPSPTFSASRKRQKTFQSYPSIGSVGNRSFVTREASGPIWANEPPEALVGRKLWTKWPEDDNFYEAVITQYKADEGRHALVYDMNTADETWEWVDLKEIPPEDIRWEGENNGIPQTRNLGHGAVRGGRKLFTPGGSVAAGGGRGRGGFARTQFRRGLLPSQNGGGTKFASEIELLNTESLVREVERIINASHIDPVELDKAKKMLKEHEQALVDAIRKLADASDDENDGEQRLLHEQPIPQG